MSSLAYLALLVATPCLVLATPDTFWYPGVGGAAPITTPTPDALLEAIRAGRTVVVHFTLPKTDDPATQSMDRVNDVMLQMVAQALHRRNVSVMCLNMADNAELAETQGISVADTIAVYKQGHQYLYNGHRSAEPLIAFINRLDTPLVTILQNKLQKKAFDHIHSTKVLGYFQTWPTSAEMIAFEAAAKAHYPRIPFLAIVTQELALNLRFSELGEIHVVHPFEKTHQVLPQNPATEADITNFLQTNARPSMQRVTMDDLHDVWATSAESRVVAFLRHRSPCGAALFKAFKNMAKFGLLRNTTDRTILLIDPEDFPTLVDHWETVFSIDLNNPALGLLNATDYTASWADLTQLDTMNTTDQLAYLSLWLEAVSAGRVRVDGLQPRPSAAHLDAVAREAANMAQRAADAAQAAAAAAQAAARAAANVQQGSVPSEPTAPADTPADTPPEGPAHEEPAKEEL